MPAMLSLTLECGRSRAGSSARCALRIRVNMSEIGSVISVSSGCGAGVLSRSDFELPTGFGHAGNEAGQGGFPERQARAPKLAQEAVAPPGHRATVHHPRGTGVLGQLREPQVVLLPLQL